MRLILIMLLSCLPLLAFAADWDGKPNHYRVRIDAQATRAKVEADLWQASEMLSMYNVMQVAGLPNGQASLVDGLRATDANGVTIALQDLGAGDYKITGGQRIRLQYAVRLEHDRYPWPAGIEEVSYRTDEGVMATGAALFFADGDAPVQAPIEVHFQLPRGWRAHTPWTRMGNVPRRYLIARHVQQLSMSVRDAGKDKQPNRQLVYGGGSLAALALDVALRERSGGTIGLPQFMQALYAQFANPGATYTLADLERIAKQLTGSDFSGFFAGAVGSQGWFDIRPSYAALGLRMDSFVEEMFISSEPTATPQQRARFEAVFGKAATAR